MNSKTGELLDKLCRLVDDNGYLLLSGGLGVGKTYLAMEIAEMSKDPKYNKRINLKKKAKKYDVVTEIVSIHSGMFYEDFVHGLTLDSDDGRLLIEDADKIFLQMIKAAKKSFDDKDGTKYILILDDINRSSISGILGNALSLIELHGTARCSIEAEDGQKILMPSNLMLILTENTTIGSVEELGSGFRRRVLTYNLVSDYSYIDDSYVNRVYSHYDSSPAAIYNKVNRLIDEHLTFRHRTSESDKQRFYLGHGMFDPNDIIASLRYRIIPLLYQYMKDGIIDKESRTGILQFEDMVYADFTKNIPQSETEIIDFPRNPSLVTRSDFIAETMSNKPIVNLIKRIKDQNLLTDTEIINAILLNPNVLIRADVTVGNRVIYTFPMKGYLCTKKTDAHFFGPVEAYKRRLYNADELKINNVDYVFAGEIQNTEKWTFNIELLKDDYQNKKNSGPSGLVLMLIAKNFYKVIIQKYRGYLDIYPGDENINEILHFAEHELLNFIDRFKMVRAVAARDWKTLKELYPKVSDKELRNIKGKLDSDANKEANKKVLDYVSDLELIWKDKGQYVTWNGKQIQIEGVYKMDKVDLYDEYYKAMTKLKINQMVLQGPPGTSKTYSTRGFLKYVGRTSNTDPLLSDDELDKMQIKDYEDETKFCAWKELNHRNPKIAWDIVQFHPSYGYEDFVRGIEVSTEKDLTTGESHISYATVNKILGKMAELAQKATLHNDTKFFLVVDEINRANLATVFGEMIFGLEYRGKGVSTPYTIKYDDGSKSNKVILPDNMYVIGTMNTADKSIGGIDYAIRRRFLFFPLLPSRETIENYKLDELTGNDKQNQQEVNNRAVQLFDTVAELFESGNLNSEYYKEDVQIGHTYFLVDSIEQLEMRFKYQIMPILREYHKDGLFQFELPSDELTGWNGLLQFVSGRSLEDDVKVHELFESLISD